MGLATYCNYFYKKKKKNDGKREGLVFFAQNYVGCGIHGLEGTSD